MKNGRKPEPQSVIAARGTFRGDRHAARIETYAPADPPVPPEELTERGRTVWAEEVTRAIAAGACEFDSSLFASYCELTAAIRAAWISGEGPIPPAAHLSEHRKLSELFGLAGPKSRTCGPGGDERNPFSRNGRKPGETP